MVSLKTFNKLKRLHHHRGFDADGGVDSGYSGVNGSSSKSDILAYQKWYNNRISKLVGSANRPITADGVWGSKTSAAWDKYGSSYSTPRKTNPTDDAKAPEEKPVDDAKKDATNSTTATDSTAKQSFVDKFKALSTPKKIAVIAIPVVAIGLAIFLIRRKK